MEKGRSVWTRNVHFSSALFYLLFKQHHMKNLAVKGNLRTVSKSATASMRSAPPIQSYTNINRQNKTVEARLPLHGVCQPHILRSPQLILTAGCSAPIRQAMEDSGETSEKKLCFTSDGTSTSDCSIGDQIDVDLDETPFRTVTYRKRRSKDIPIIFKSTQHSSSGKLSLTESQTKLSPQHKSK